MDSVIKSVTLEQGNSFQPRIHVQFDLKYVQYENDEPDYIVLMGIKGKLFVRTQKPDWFELCMVEQDGSNSVRIGNNTIIHMIGTLTPYLMAKLEELRSGNDLWFRVNQATGWCVPRRSSGSGFETLNIQSRGSGEFKYPRSEWIEHINTTQFNKIELLELPKIEFPKIELTEHIVKFINNARRAFDEGRYGDVLKECRNSLEALDSGLDAWFSAKKREITPNEEPNTKKADKRKNQLAVLLNNDEKANRLNNIIRDLHYYLSLNPHEAEYKGIIFTNYDAKFVLQTVGSLVNDVLKHIEDDISD